MSNQVEEFQKNFVTVVEDTAYLLDDDQFKKDNGFSFTEYISKGNLNNISELGIFQSSINLCSEYSRKSKFFY